MRTTGRTLCFFACVVGVTLFGATSGAQTPPPPTGAVNVQVSGGGGAKVTVTELGGLKTSRTMTAGNNGRADFSGLPRGNYEVRVEIDGKVGTSYVRVDADRPVQAPFATAGLPSAASMQSTPDALLDAVKRAAEACDRSSYDLALQELQRAASLADTNVRDLNNLVEEYGRLSGYQPNLEQLRTTLRRIEGSLFTGRRGALGDARRADAPVDPGLVYLIGYVNALEQLEKARQRQRAFEAALRAVPPFSQRCASNIGQPYQFQVTGDVGLVALQRPALKLFRSELGGAIETGLFKADNKDTTIRVGASLGTRFDAPLLGDGKQMGVEVRGWYKGGSLKDGVEQIAPPPAGTLGLFSPATMGNPFGGYFTGQPLNDVRYAGDYRSFGGEVQLQTWFRSGDFTFMPSVGLRLGHNDLDERIGATVGMGPTTFEQKNTINDFFVGPILGLRGRYQFAGGLYSFGGVSLGLDYHNAKGNWQTFVLGFDTEPRRDKLSSSKWGLSAGVEFGIGWQSDGLSAQLSAGAYHYSAAPYLKFPEADSTATGTGGAGIGFAGQTEYQLKVGVAYRF